MLTSEQLLIEKQVKSFFKKKWDDQKHWIHCQAVQDACLGMIQGTKLDPEIFIIASWIHDLGKLEDKEPHHLHSLGYLKKYMEKHKLDKQNAVIIEDCILQHRSFGNPASLEASIFKIADKVALYNKKWIEWKTHS